MGRESKAALMDCKRKSNAEYLTNMEQAELVRDLVTGPTTLYTPACTIQAARRLVTGPTTPTARSATTDKDTVAARRRITVDRVQYFSTTVSDDEHEQGAAMRTGETPRGRLKESNPRPPVK